MSELVILDGYTLNGGDLSWKPLEAFCSVTVYEHTPPEDILTRAKGANYLLTNKTFLTAKILKQLPNLKYVGLLSTGTNAVDLEQAERQGITVTNVPGYSGTSVAQHVFGFILNFTNQIQSHSDSVHRGDWQQHRDFCYALNPMQELSGKTIGIIGFGSIGRKVAEIAKAFEMKVLVHTRRPETVTIGEYAERDAIFSQSDFLTLHCPLTAETEEIISNCTLGLMKENSFLINTGRGGLINEKDLANALREKRIAGAGLDVLSTEPPSAENPLLGLSNCVISPHNSWMTLEARGRLITQVFENFEAFLKGEN